jgi:RNA polymerase sigma factor (sigma-70 family)
VTADAAMFTAAYPTVTPVLRAYIRGRLHPSHRRHTDDILGEVWRRAWQGRATHHPERGDFSAWLHGIARRLIVDFLRSPASRDVLHARPGELGAEQLADSAEVVALRRWTSEQVRSAVAALPHRGQRDVAVLFGLGGLSQGEAAAALGSNAPAVRQLFVRARRSLRHVLAGVL